MEKIGILCTAALLGGATFAAAGEPGADEDAPVAIEDTRDAGESVPEATDLDLDELMNLRVTSPGKKEQAFTQVPAAIHVIRADDMRRSGSTSIPEALRPVPGVQVARNRSSSWAISARGFNDVLSNKLLVLIDGRSVYSPLHSGVFWDVQDTFLEDVDRIEVIRGPGGSLWGANAINGVINVITKPAEETQGGVVIGGGGTEEQDFAGVRYGFKAAEDLHLRVYGKWFERDATIDGLDPDRDAHDGWFMARGGFRSDWTPRATDRVTLMGDYYDGQVEERVMAPSLTAPTGVATIRNRMDVQGGNLIFRWQRELSPTSDMTFQAYYDYTFRSEALFTDTLHTGDADFQHRFQILERNDVIWGLGYRIYRSEFNGSFAFQTDPEDHTDDIVSAFVQDEITIIEERLRLTLGSKFEFNDYSGFEAQPSGRLALDLGPRHMAWGAVSRAVRTPSIIDTDVRLTPIVFPGVVPVVASIFGRSGFESEELIAYELGYRMRPLDVLSVDVAGFYNRYDRLRSGQIGAPFVEASPPPVHAVVPINLRNQLEGRTWGVEVAANLQAAPWWLVQANYAYLDIDLSSPDQEGRDPQHSVWVRSAFDLPWNFTLDLVGRYVSELDSFDIDSYIELDVRLAWRDRSGRFEAAIVGQNLLDNSHPEFGAASQRSEIQRGVYGSLSWRF